MKNFLNLEQTQPSIDRSIKAANVLKSEIPTQTDIETIPLFNLSSVVEDIHKIRRPCYARISGYL